MRGKAHEHHPRAALLAALAPVAAQALPRPGASRQTARFPERPIEIVVGFVAGGGTDLDARSLRPGAGAAAGRHGRGHQPARRGRGAGARQRGRGPSRTATRSAPRTIPGLLTIPIERQAQFKLDDFAPLGQPRHRPQRHHGPRRRPLRSLEGRDRAARASAGQHHLRLARHRHRRPPATRAAASRRPACGWPMWSSRATRSCAPPCSASRWT